MTEKRRRFLPFILSIVLIVLDQLSKLWIIKNIPVNTVGYSFWGDFLRIIHVRNRGAAFSLGAGSGNFFRVVCFVLLPIAAMTGISFLIASGSKIFNKYQRWYAAGILGGGIGTIIDRVFRFKEGVVDFISVKFYGILGMDRWPTFNVSDSCVVVFVILFGLSVLLSKDGNN